jgi:hypothetical protein
MKSESDWLPLAHRWAGPALAAAVVAFGAWLRFSHIDGPFEQPDEPVATYVVAHVLSTPGFDTNWAHTQLRDEAGPAQYNFSSYYLTLAGLERTRQAFGLRPPNEAFDARTVFFRECSAVFSVLALVGVLGIAQRIGGWGLALAAGLWVAVDPLLVQDSHYARPEAFLVFLVVCLLALALARGAPGILRPTAAGLVFGFLIACKVTLVLWFWLPLMACFPRAADWTGAGWAARLRRLAGVGFGTLAGFAAGAPRAVSDLGGYLAGIRYLKNGYGGTFNFYSHANGAPVADYVVHYLWATTGWALACLFLVGLAATAVRRRWPQLIGIFAPPVVLIAFMGTQHSFFERNLSHAVPFYLIGAGFGLLALLQLPSPRRWTLASLPLLAVAAAIVPAEISVRLVQDGFSGRYERHRVAQLTAFLASLSERPLDGSHLVRATDDDNPWFRQPKNGPGPYVALWQDVNPEITRAGLARLHEHYTFEERATFPGLFDDLPGPNTLRDYLGRTVRVLVFRDGPHSRDPRGAVPAKR